MYKKNKEEYQSKQQRETLIEGVSFFGLIQSIGIVYSLVTNQNKIVYIFILTTLLSFITILFQSIKK